MRTLPTDNDLRDGTNEEYCTQAVGWTAHVTSAVSVSTLPTRNQRFIELSSALGDRPWEESGWDRRRRQHSRPADDTSRPQPTTSDEKPTTSALTPSAATRRRRRQPKSVEIMESSPSPPAIKRTATTSDVADDLALSTSTSRPTSDAGSTDDMFVDITDEEAATEIDLPTSRVPTRPLSVAAPHLRRVGRREAVRCSSACDVRPDCQAPSAGDDSVDAYTTSHCEPSQVQSRPRR